MPDSPLALSIIKLAGVPLAAPSANASTKPSPTTAEHVKHDLDGQIEIIIDGGPCQVGVESTVVDGLCDPPVVLRPGGVSIDRIRECAGWEGVVNGYKDQSEIGIHMPRAPGMKYKHYSPKAKVILFEASGARGFDPDLVPGLDEVEDNFDRVAEPTLPTVLGIVRTRHWKRWAGWNDSDNWKVVISPYAPIRSNEAPRTSPPTVRKGQLWTSYSREFLVADIIEISLGKDTKSIAHGLFSALRELDERGVQIIVVEGIEDEGDIAAAVMNRLRKAASDIRH
jgi:L-threonylcarbamoyladenylate synthase